MVHMADPNAKERIYELSDGESFVNFVEKSPTFGDTQLSFIVMNQDG